MFLIAMNENYINWVEHKDNIYAINIYDIVFQLGLQLTLIFD